MESLKQILYEKQLELEEIEKTNKKILERLPEGYVNISKNKNSIQYYWRKDDGTETYINKKNRSIIKKLAQKEYEKKVQIIVKKNKKCLRDMLDKYEFDETLKAYDKISDKKKIFVEPYTMPNEMYAEKWQAEQNKLKEQNMSKVSEKYIFTDKDNEILTEKGEAVRSKSEKIIAVKLYMNGIPYVYEQPLYLKGYGYVVPDFKILNIRTRKEYYLEHFGMMDDSEYSRKALRKIETFQKNNIFPGDNLLMTFETSDSPLNTRILEELVKKYLV